MRLSALSAWNEQPQACSMPVQPGGATE